MGTIPESSNYNYIRNALIYYSDKIDKMMEIVRDNPEVFETCYSLEEDLQEVKDKIKQALEINFGSTERK